MDVNGLIQSDKTLEIRELESKSSSKSISTKSHSIIFQDAENFDKSKDDFSHSNSVATNKDILTKQFTDNSESISGFFQKPSDHFYTDMNKKPSSFSKSDWTSSNEISK